MTKVEVCPNCGGTDLGDQWWGGGRLLKQYCRGCTWRGPTRVPEQREVKITKKVLTGQFAGWYYEVFDRYGHAMIYSRHYQSEEEADKDLQREMESGRKDQEAGPYTGVLWPAYVEVQGKVYR
jgi:hypothetical protein